MRIQCLTQGHYCRYQQIRNAWGPHNWESVVLSTEPQQLLAGIGGKTRRGWLVLSWKFFRTFVFFTFMIIIVTLFLHLYSQIHQQLWSGWHLGPTSWHGHRVQEEHPVPPWQKALELHTDVWTHSRRPKVKMRQNIPSNVFMNNL